MKFARQLSFSSRLSSSTEGRSILRTSISVNGAIKYVETKASGKERQKASSTSLVLCRRDSFVRERQFLLTHAEKTGLGKAEQGGMC